MPLFILVSIFLVLIAIVLVEESSGWRKIASWMNLALLVAPLLIAGAGGMLLAKAGLAWRSCVKLPCAVVFVAGILALLVQLAAFLWKLVEYQRPVVRVAGRGVIFVASAFLLMTMGWYGLLFGAIWSGGDREVTVKGQRMVMEYAWMDQDYYAYHGPLTRGRDRVYGSWELNKEDFGETEK